MRKRAQEAAGAGDLGEEVAGFGLVEDVLELGDVGGGTVAGALDHPGAGAREARGGRALLSRGGLAGARDGEGAGLPLRDEAQEAVLGAEEIVVDEEPGGLFGMGTTAPALDQEAKVVEPGGEEGGYGVHWLVNMG